MIDVIGYVFLVFFSYIALAIAVVAIGLVSSLIGRLLGG